VLKSAEKEKSGDSKKRGGERAKVDETGKRPHMNDSAKLSKGGGEGGGRTSVKRKEVFARSGEGLEDGEGE